MLIYGLKGRTGFGLSLGFPPVVVVEFPPRPLVTFCLIVITPGFAFSPSMGGMSIYRQRLSFVFSIFSGGFFKQSWNLKITEKLCRF